MVVPVQRVLCVYVREGCHDKHQPALTQSIIVQQQTTHRRSTAAHSTAHNSVIFFPAHHPHTHLVLGAAAAREVGVVARSLAEGPAKVERVGGGGVGACNVHLLHGIALVVAANVADDVAAGGNVPVRAEGCGGSALKQAVCKVQLSVGKNLKKIEQSQTTHNSQLRRP